MPLVDASVWIHALRRRRKGSTRIQKQLEPLVLSGNAAVTEWTVLQLMVGIRASENAKRFLEKFERLPRLAFPTEKWPQTWELAADLRRKGFTPSASDCFISMVAIAHDLPLLHCDRDFEQIAKHSSLKTLDWTEYV